MSVFNILTAVKSQSEKFPIELDDIKIVFEGLRIYDLDGTNRVDVMFVEEVAEHGIYFNERPSWSPDGQLIVYINNGSNIYVVDSNGNNPQKVSEGRDGYKSPQWSPNGQRIVFVGDGGIHFVDISNQNETILIENSRNMFINNIIWSNDSKSILYRTCCEYASLQVINIDNLRSDEIIRVDTGELDVFHSWSPDGESILFAMGIEDHMNVYIINSNDKNLTQLTHHEANDFKPSWSPSGQKISFLSDREGDYALYIMNVDGTQLKKLADNVSDKYFDGYRWSPNSQYIAFAQEETIKLVNVETGEQNSLLNYNSYDAVFRSVHEIRWHPSSHGLLVDLHYSNVTIDESRFRRNLTEFRWVDLKCLDTELGCTSATIEELVIPSPIPESEDYSISPFINR